MFKYPDISRELAEMYETGLVISPWLSGVGTVRFDPNVFETIDLGVSEFALTNWTVEERTKVFGSLPANDRIAKTAIYEIVSSTAVFQAHEKTGSLDVDEETAAEALKLVKMFVQKYSFSTLILLYMLATSWENQSALAHYGDIPEQEFLYGQWHRPWIDYSIWDELLFDCLIGTTRIVTQDNVRYVQLTKNGYETLERITGILKRAGYFSQRLRTLRISQFSLYENYDEVAAEIWPDAMDRRQSFLEWSGIKPGMKVLELGCADGIFTFDGGLAKKIGPKGSLISVDPSSSMLARANKRKAELGYNWVTFQQGIAENLPFPDGEFDAVIASAVLHFTDRPVAIREMRRVTRPGGLVSSFHPIKFQSSPSFFTDWFSPLFSLAAKRNEKPKDYLPYEDEVAAIFKDVGITDISSQKTSVTNLYHDPDKVVRHMIEGVGWFSEELAQLPWKARTELIQSLKDKGREVCEKYPANERVFQYPNQMIKGFVPLG